MSIIDTMNAINIENLNTKINGSHILNDVNIRIEKNQTTAIIGESGSGKTMLAKSIIGLLPENAEVKGNIEKNGKIGLIMQDPFSSLDPMQKVKKQILSAVPKDKRASFDIESSLKEVGLEKDISEKYPHELSGGMRQRIVIATVLATKPDIIIADEATTALDLITENDILDLLENISKAKNQALIIITHNFKIVKDRTNYVYIMDNGKVIEEGKTSDIFSNPKTNKTKALIEATRDLEFTAKERTNRKLLEIENLNKNFGQKTALSNIEFDVFENDNIGIIGESGSGKTTLARIICGLETKSDGKLGFEKDFSIGYIFQDPKMSLNPAWTARKTILEAKPDSLEKVIKMAEFPAKLLDRKPHELSGGQCQRVSIARALSMNPKLLILDEAVSALDFITEKKFLETIKKLYNEKNMTLLFISHDLRIIKNFSDYIIAMKDSEIVEQGYNEEVFQNPKNEWVKRLIDCL